MWDFQQDATKTLGLTAATPAQGLGGRGGVWGGGGSVGAEVRGLELCGSGLESFL